jgi:hypothetical protein
LEYCSVRGIEDGELAWMHGYPEVMRADIVPDFLELSPEIASPVKLAYVVRGEGNKVRTYSEKKDVMLYVKSQHLPQAIKVISGYSDEAILRVRLKPKRAVAFASDCPVHTGVSNFHFTLSKSNVCFLQPSVAAVSS